VDDVFKALADPTRRLLLDRRPVGRLHHAGQGHQKLLPRVPTFPPPRASDLQAVFHLVPLAELHELLEPLPTRLQPVLLLVLTAQLGELVDSLPTEPPGRRADGIDRV